MALPELNTHRALKPRAVIGLGMRHGTKAKRRQQKVRDELIKADADWRCSRYVSKRQGKCEVQNERSHESKVQNEVPT